MNKHVAMAREAPDGGPSRPSLRPLILSLVRAAIPPLLVVDMLRARGGIVGFLVLAALLLVGSIQISWRYRALHACWRAQDEAEQQRQLIAINAGEAIDCRLITLFGLLSPLALVGRLRSNAFDRQDLVAAMVFVLLALASQLAWRPAVRRDGAQLRETPSPGSP